MQEKEIAQKIGHLTELMNNPNRNEGSVLRIFHELFQLTNEGRDLPPSTAEWCSEAASFFLSPQLLRVLFKLRLEVYGFQFAALNFTDIDDVIDDLSNGDVLKGIQSFPPGAYSKLKRELIKPPINETASGSETKKSNEEKSDLKRDEDNSALYNSLLANFLTGNETKELVNDTQLSVVSSGGADSLHQEGAYKNVKRKLDVENQDSFTSPSKFHQLGPVFSSPTHLSAPIYDECNSLSYHIPVRRRLAEKLIAKSRFIEENTSGMQLFQLPLKRKILASSSETERWVFGQRCTTKVECKTILLMGATGSGKTTLINSMVNYILGVEWDDPFRFLLISEEGASLLPNSQAHSQTSKVTAYELHHQVGFKVPYSLIIVDTPGYGDTKGIERDREITESIQQFFKDEKGIQELDAVGFTVQSALARLTPSQKYIFESILAIFGNDVKDNIRFLVTFTDGQTPPVLEAIKEASIAHQLDIHGQPRHHRFNNSGFFTSNQNDGDTDFSPMFWKLGMKNFESFFSSLSTMKTRSLTLTNEVLEERKHINITIEGLTLKIHKQLTKMEELRKTKQMIENHSDQINANKDFKYTVTVSKGDKIEITDGKCTTNCSKCSMSCHFPCGLDVTDDKRKCAAMDKEDGLCKACPLKCKWDLHLNQSYHWIFKDVTETRTYEEILKKYEEAVQHKLSTEGVLQALEGELEQIKFDLKSDINTIATCLQRLDRIALRPDAFTATDYIELMIQSETKEKKPGFHERICSLNSLLDRATLMNKIRAGESVLPVEGASSGQSCSVSKVTIKPQPSVMKRTTITWPRNVWDRAQQFAPWARSQFSPQQLMYSGKRFLKKPHPSDNNDEVASLSD